MTTAEEKKRQIALHFEKILEVLELDLTNPSLRKTPERVAKMYVDEVFSGLNRDTYPKVSFLEESLDQELVFIKNIALVSFCEHHFVPMIGLAHVAYLPKKGVVGLSGIHHIVRYYAKQPQIQERLTKQIADALQAELQTEDVAVAIKMQHFCLLARSMEDQKSHVETHVLKGCFQSDPSIQSAFFLRIAN